MGLIILCTPHHTATWFWVSFFYNHPEVSGFTTFRRMREAAKFPNSELRTHRVMPGMESDSFTEKFCPGKTNLLHIHMETDLKLTPQHFLSTSEHFVAMLLNLPVIISTRDPLAALITRHYRHPNLVESTDLLDAWKHMVELYQLVKVNSRLKIIPVDLLETYHNRLEASRACLSVCGLSDNGYAEKWGHEWPRKLNSQGAYKLKVAYNQKDLNYLKTNLGVLWTQLCESESLLRPFLENLGYKELLWWS